MSKTEAARYFVERAEIKLPAVLLKKCARAAAIADCTAALEALE